uniref:Putative secreted protein ovary overexpressed n=1 Tax=Rhipicephalus microplus TaxID=6941 RepID=A0A6M2D8N9_RHIMP
MLLQRLPFVQYLSFSSATLVVLYDLPQALGILCTILNSYLLGRVFFCHEPHSPTLQGTLASETTCPDVMQRRWLEFSVTDQPASAITTSSLHFVERRSSFSVGQTVETISNFHSSAQVLKRMGHVLVCSRPPRIDNAACTGDVAPPPISRGFDGETYWLSLQSTKLH